MPAWAGAQATQSLSSYILDLEISHASTAASGRHTLHGGRSLAVLPRTQAKGYHEGVCWAGTCAFCLQDCNACYCIAIAHLINHPQDAAGAVHAAEQWAEQHAVGEAQQWLQDSAKPGQANDCLHMIGFVKWGFTYAFRYMTTS